MAKKKKRKNEKNIRIKDSKSLKNEKILYAFLGAFLTIIGFIIALAIKRDDEYVMYYAKHGLILFIGWIIAMLFSLIPVLGILIWIFVITLWVITWIYSLSGEQKRNCVLPKGKTFS